MNALEYAIQMEIDGENYYSAQARLNKDNGAGVVCRLLALAERSHEELLRQLLHHQSYVLPAVDSDKELRSLFKENGDLTSDIRSTPKQLEIYRHALELERESIALYTGLLEDTASTAEKDVILFLIGQEKRHYALLDDIITMLRHAEEWVESAEFGLRNETY